MGKKGLKRKTRWRPLSISECTIIDDTNTSSIASITNSTTETNIEEDDTTYKYSVKNSSYLRRKPFTSFSSSTSTNNKTDYRNNYNNNNNSNSNNNNNNNYYRNTSNKHNNNNNNSNNTISSSTTTSTIPLYSSSTGNSRYSYRRRPFSASNHHQKNDSLNSNKYYSSRLIGGGGGGSNGINGRDDIGNGSVRSINRQHHRTISEPSDKENSCISSSSLKPQLNEDEYTRITTPRQDVIFKKSYLNQPKRYLSSTDTNTTSSAAASVVSTEESISATSVPSLSPEQCSSITDSIDPEQAFMYSYFDQNGVFYVNPFLSNGFDQYGQMFMLPYGYSPYMFPQDIISSPLVNGVDTEESQISNETNENKNDLKDSNNEIVININDENNDNNNTEKKFLIKNNNYNNNNNDKDKNLSESCDSIQKTIIKNNDKINLNNNNNNNDNDNTINISDNKNDDDDDNENDTTIKVNDTDDNSKLLPSSTSSLSSSSSSTSMSPSSSSSSSSSTSTSPSSSSLSSTNKEENVECKNDNDENNKNNENNGAKLNNINTNNNKNNNDSNNKNDQINKNNEKLEENNYRYRNHMKGAEIIPSCDPNDYYNYGYHQFYPPIFYPYMYSQPFIPIFTKEYGNSADLYDDDDDRNNGAKRRKRMKLDENSTDVTTTDYSEDDEYTEEDDITETPEITDTNESSVGCEICDSLKENRLSNNDEKDGTEKNGLNTNVEEFVPKANKPHLNVHVKEFHPRRYATMQQNGSSVVNKTEEISDKKEAINTPTIIPDKQNLVAVESATQISTTAEQKTTENKLKSENREKTVEKNDEKKNSIATNVIPKSSVSSKTVLSSSQFSVVQQKEDKSKINSIPLPPSTGESAVKETAKLPPKLELTEKPVITLAEKIKITLSEESRAKVKQNPKQITTVSKPITSIKSKLETSKIKRTEKKIIPQKNPKGTGSGVMFEQIPQPQRKKSLQLKKNELQDQKTIESQKIATETIKNVPTYAQMLNNNDKINTKINKKNPAIEKSTKELPIESHQQQKEDDKQQNSVQSRNHKTADNVNAQVWVTIKSKGKRSKQIKEVVTVFEDEESILDEDNKPIVSHRNESNEVKKESMPVPTEITDISDTKESPKEDIEIIDTKTSIISKESSPIEEVKNEMTSNSSNKKKSSKSKSKKSRKTSVLNKKMKGFELKEPKIEFGTKTQIDKENQDKLHTVDVNVETLLDLTPKESEEDLTLSHIYGPDKKNPFSRTFASSSLEILNGFDYKFFKGSSILKEEEEMVLNVIKSLSHNQKKISTTIKCEESASNEAKDIKESEIEKAEPSKEIVDENFNDESKVNEEIELESVTLAELSTENLVNDRLVEVKENQYESNSQCSGDQEDIVSESPASSESSEFDQMKKISKISEDAYERIENVIETVSEQRLENSTEDSQDIPVKVQPSSIIEANNPVCNGSLEVTMNGGITNGHCNGISADSDENSESFQFHVIQDEKEESNKARKEKDEPRIEPKIGTTEDVFENCTVFNGEDIKTLHIEEVHCPENDMSDKVPNGINHEAENVNFNDESCQKNTENISDSETVFKKDDDAKDDFYKLLKVDNNMSTSIADQLKTIEEQLRNLERIASVTSLNGSRNDISCTSDNEIIAKPNDALSFKNSQTAENFHNDKITISSNSIPSDQNESMSFDNENTMIDSNSLDNRILNQSTSTTENTDNCSFNVDTDHSNSISNIILVPNDDHVLNGCKQTQLLLLNNEYEISNGVQTDKKNDSSHEQVQTVKSSSVDRIRSNSVEYCCNQEKHQKVLYNSNEISSSVCNNLKAVSDSSINAIDSSCEYPLTNAVRKWLKDNTKDKIPEPILRIPNDPTLSTRIKSTLVEQHHQQQYPITDPSSELVDNNELENSDSEQQDEQDETDEDNIKKRYEINNYNLNHSKNLISNPSHVSSAKNHKNNNRHFIKNNCDEIDSDYNSDNQHQQQNKNHQNDGKNQLESQSNFNKRFDFDDNTCERVASLIISGTTTTIITTEDEAENDYINDNINNSNLHNDIITIPPPLSINQKYQQQKKCQFYENHQKNSINDLLDYWDDEFIENPKKWLNIRQQQSDDMNNLSVNDIGVHKSNIILNNNHNNERIKQKNLQKKKRKRKTKRKSSATSVSSSPSETTTETLLKSTSSQLSIQSSSTIDEIELIPYESVYGKTIDYKRLLNDNNNYELLSNAYINNNLNMNLKNIKMNSLRLPNLNRNLNLIENHKYHQNDNNNKNESLNNINHTIINNLNNNNDINNFDNDNNIKFIGNNQNNHKIMNNCLKPPEVCCILM